MFSVVVRGYERYRFHWAPNISTDQAKCPTSVICVAQNRKLFQMSALDTRAMGRFSDLVWYDLSVSKSTGFATTLHLFGTPG